MCARASVANTVPLGMCVVAYINESNVCVYPWTRQHMKRQRNWISSSCVVQSREAQTERSHTNTHPNTLFSVSLSVSGCQRDMTNFSKQNDSINTGPNTSSDAVVDRNPLSSYHLPPLLSELNVTGPCPKHTHPVPPPTLSSPFPPPCPQVSADIAPSPAAVN